MRSLKNNVVLVICLFLAGASFAQPTKIRPKARPTGPVLAKPTKPKPTALGACSAAKMAEILAPATASKSTVKVDCNLRLKSTDIVTKRLIFEGSAASGITCNCNGATLDGSKGKVNYNRDMIEVRSKKTGATTWARPENITFKNCNIIGSVRIWGMGKNGEAKDVKESSKRERTKPSRHVLRVRNAAPKNIVFDNITITGVSRNPLYFAPGVTYCKLINSEMKGKSSKVGIYFDAESAYNTIKNNYIHVNTAEDNWGKAPFVTNRGWPQVALDGSSNNKIISNRFSSLNNGGIYFYRNCGEGGTIRHTPPERNIIINNSFYYNKYKGSKPAIYLGSRDYGLKESTFGHCDADDGRPYGSSKSDKDYAKYNVIMQNQFYKRNVWKSVGGQNRLVKATLADMIMTKNKSSNSPNYIAYNELVSAKVNRKGGCYVRNGYKDFLLHGQFIDVFKVNGRLACGKKMTCNDGELVTTTSNCKITEVPFDCVISNSNKGCSKTVACPRGMKIVGVRIACNLEHGTVSNSALSAVKLNQIKVVKASDKVSSGSCFIGKNKISKGAKTLYDIQDEIRALVGCKEYDKNGGDCHVKGILYCR